MDVFFLDPEEKRLAPWVKQYGKEIDWEALAGQDEEVAKCYCENRLDFSRPEARHVVAKASLAVHWKIKWQCPKNTFLAPCIPNRVAYLVWIHEELMPKPKAKVIDVGTGASLIYPLLGAKIFHWSFVATDIDAAAIKVAERNAKLNPDLDITIIHVDPDRPPLTSGLSKKTETNYFEISITNPPFFADEEDRDNAVQGRQRPEGRTVCTHSEEIVQGGEVHFVKRIHYDPCPVLWKTALLGKKSSQKELLHFFHHDPTVALVKSSSFQLGNTVRYLIAWTLDPAQVARPFTFTLSSPIELTELSTRLYDYFKASALDFTLSMQHSTSRIHAVPASLKHPELHFSLTDKGSKVTVTLASSRHMTTPCPIDQRPLAKSILVCFNKLRDAMPGDISRTNRRWRRRLTRTTFTASDR